MQIFSNLAISSLSAAIDDAVSTFVVQATDGGLFTDPGLTDYELVTLTDGTLWEVVMVTNRVNDTFTVTRAFEGVARAWPIGTIVKSSITKATLDEFMQKQQVGSSLNLFAYQNFR